MHHTSRDSTARSRQLGSGSAPQVPHSFHVEAFRPYVDVPKVHDCFIPYSRLSATRTSVLFQVRGLQAGRGGRDRVRRSLPVNPSGGLMRMAPAGGAGVSAVRGAVRVSSAGPPANQLKGARLGVRTTFRRPDRVSAVPSSLLGRRLTRGVGGARGSLCRRLTDPTALLRAALRSGGEVPAGRAAPRSGYDDVDVPGDGC